MERNGFRLAAPALARFTRFRPFEDLWRLYQPLPTPRRVSCSVYVMSPSPQGGQVDGKSNKIIQCPVAKSQTQVCLRDTVCSLLTV